jgi:thermitase
MMPKGKSPLRRWLLALAVFVWCAGAALTPSNAESPCLTTEDGRCLPAPVMATEGLRPRGNTSLKHASPPSKGPGALVRRRDEVPPAQLSAALQATRRPARGLAARGWWRVSPAPGETMDDLLARLGAMPEIAYVEEDTPVEAAYVPNDAYLTSQWALWVTGATDAWDRSKGRDDVWIAVVDTGVDTKIPTGAFAAHPDRPARLLWGLDLVNDDDDPSDDHNPGHGTHVAGIVAAAMDNGLGIAGLCPGCSVLAIKVLGADGRGWNSDVAEGIAYAAYWGHQHNKRTIINVSLGGGPSTVVHEAVAYAQGLGALVVAAAGNDGHMAPNYPAALDGVLAVAATDPSDTPAWFSQYGDLAAPGTDILSTIPWRVGTVTEPYTLMSGTSMAAPMVAGAAALVWSAEPALTAAEVRERLLSSADVPTGWDPSFGVGRLNLAAALPPPSTPTPPPTPQATPSPTPTVIPTARPTTTPTAPLPRIALPVVVAVR